MRGLAGRPDRLGRGSAAESPRSASLSHGWASTPASALPEYVLGVQVSWAGESGAHEFSMSVTAPPGTNGSIAVPTYGAANPVVEVGGKVVWSGGSFTATTG
jgi:alpha-L-rhamnosidase